MQRVPVPLGMWRFGDERNGFPLMLRYPATIRFGIDAPGSSSATNSSLFGPLFRRYRETLTCFLARQTCTGHPARSFRLSSTSPLKTGQIFGQFPYMRQATDEDLPRSEPIASSVSSAAQNRDVARLQSTCLPAAPLSTLRGVIQAESSGNPNAMQIDYPKALLKRWNLPQGTLRLKRQPTNQREGLDWLAYFQRYDIFVDLGLMQVSTAEAKRRGISPASLLERCTNLRVGWQILEDDYRIEQRIYGPGQEALQHAISRYNTGERQQGIANGYFRPRPCSSPQTPGRAAKGEAMIVLSSERRHDQGVKDRMANDRWNDAPALPAAQTVDNTSNNRQFQIDPATSVGNCKYKRHAEHDHPCQHRDQRPFQRLVDAVMCSAIRRGFRTRHSRRITSVSSAE